MVKNSYHVAILAATNNERFMDLVDLWRSYHPFSNMADNDYQKSIIDCGLDRSGARKYDERRNGQTVEKKLYVPVTRKVTVTDDSFTPKLKSKLSAEVWTNALPNDHVYF